MQARINALLNVYILALTGQKGENQVKLQYALLGVMAALSVGMNSTAAYANSDDDAWIAQCVKDNKDEDGATPTIVKTYCTCMDNKMSSNETRSITEWEKSHPSERKACEKEAGWK